MIFTALNYLYFFYFWLYVIYLPIYFQTIGIGVDLIGILISLFPLSMFLLIFPLGILSDRLDSRALLLAGAGILAIFNTLVWLAQGEWGFFLAMMVGGVGLALYNISMYSLYFKSLGKEARGFKVALFNVGGVLGLGTGPAIGGVLMKKFGMEGIFILGYLAIAVMILAALFVPRAKIFRFRLKDYREDLLKPGPLFAIGVIFIIYTHVGFEQMGYGLLLKEHIGLDETAVGAVFPLIALWVVPVTLLAGRVYDRIERPVIILGLALLWSSIFQALTPSAWSFASVVGIRLLHTTGDSFFDVTSLVLVSLVFPAKRVGGNWGFVFAISTAAMMTTASAGGFLAQRWGYGAPFIASGALVAAASFLILLFHKKIQSVLGLR